MNNRTESSRPRALRLLVAAAWTFFILVLCSIPGRELPEIRVVSADKIGHFTMFAVFGWLWMYSLRMEVRTRFRWVVAAGLAYAVLMEIYQGIVPIGRESELWDALANSAGLLTGASIWRFRRRKPRSAETTA